MLDQTLQDWRIYQQSKRTVKLAKMDEIKTFPCLVLIESNYVEAYLQIIENTTGRYIHIVSRKRPIGSVRRTFIKTSLASLRSYDRENSKIILTLEEEVEQEEAEEVDVQPIMLQFINADTMDAAFAAIEEFGRERVKNMPTPPSTSSESD